jgi:hypothetical protein
MWAERQNPPPSGEGDCEAVEGAGGERGLSRVVTDLPPSGALRTPVSPRRGEI